MAFEIKSSLCRVCAGGCPMNVWLKDDELLKVEPQAGGKLCARGYAYRDYVLRPDRIQTPLKRVGKRGSGKWKEITWEEAYSEIAAKLNRLKKKYGAESVAFYTGYSKWYRPVLHRLVHSFGSLNYGTESSTCHMSMRMASLLTFGTLTRPDIMRSDLFIGWGYNPFFSQNFDGMQLENYKEKGGKIIIVDPKVTPAAKFADVLLRVNPGTDGALALFFGNYLIEKGAIDEAYIAKYVHGFAEYKKEAKKYTLEKTSSITGITEGTLLKAADILAESARISCTVSGAAIPHHINGMQNIRAIYALIAITGNFDRQGGILPVEYSNEDFNIKVLWDDFVDESRPLSEDGSGYQNSPVWHRANPRFDPAGHKTVKPKIGSQRFPLWSVMIDEFQSMDLTRQIETAEPYPIKAIFALGMNHKMFVNNEKLLAAIEKLDFFVDVDLFWTTAARHADIVLPACSSLERQELIAQGPTVRFTEPAIKPLYQSKSDVDIICELANYLELDYDDKILRSGYETVCKYVLRRVGVTLDALKASPTAVKIPGTLPFFEGRNLADGLRTPTGKIELYSETIAQISKSYNLDPVPTYRDSLNKVGKAKYPLILTAGGRIPGEFHSRLMGVKTTKVFRPNAAADIHPLDAANYGIGQGDPLWIRTETGQIQVEANLTNTVKKGVVFMFQDYENANVNNIIPLDHLDPYSGFPGYRTVRCAIERGQEP